VVTGRRTKVALPPRGGPTCAYDVVAARTAFETAWGEALSGIAVAPLMVGSRAPVSRDARL
jgi:hypothetical protein